HLAIEPARDCSCELDLRVEQRGEIDWAGKRHLRVYHAAFHLQLQIKRRVAGVSDEVCASHESTYGGPLTIEFCTNELAKFCLWGSRWRAVPLEDYLLGLYLRTKTGACRPDYKNSISGCQSLIGRGFDIDCIGTFLNEKVHIAPHVVSDYTRKGDRETTARLFIRERVDSAEGRQGSALSPD